MSASACDFWFEMPVVRMSKNTICKKVGGQAPPPPLPLPVRRLWNGCESVDKVADNIVVPLHLGVFMFDFTL